jgi:thioredoxin reductase (NADPH)
MPQPVAFAPSIPPDRAARMFPALSPAQMARAAAHGSARSVRAGEVLVTPGDATVPFFIIRSGRIDIVRESDGVETVIVSHGPGSFTGEANILLGRPAGLCTRAADAGEVIEVTRAAMLALVQTDTDIGDIIMRGFIYRRLELIEQGLSDVVLLGSMHCASTLRIREFLIRNGHPFAYVDLDREADVEALLTRFHVQASDVPVLICHGDTVLRNPSNEAIAACLGFNLGIDRARVRDVVVVGAGPAGLAAAVYAASEGLDVLLLEADAPGGQAGASSRIENYLGFPNGVSGRELTSRALTQAQKFGAQVMVASGAVSLRCGGVPYNLELREGPLIPARSVILATGAQYRRLPLENLDRFLGAGVYYSATPMEAQLCVNEEVIVVGGGNSAGQAAVFLSASARRVHILVRSDGLASTMSRYLIRRIEDSPAIELHARTEIVALAGERQLQTVRWRDARTGATDTREIRHVFLMTGAVPNTVWLQGCVALDDKGFVKTGTALAAGDRDGARWPHGRSPLPLETSRPGIFAVGDVRSGSMKRVAAAVGEGSAAVAFVHQVLAE